MTDEKMNKITIEVADIFRDTKFYDCIFCDKGTHANCCTCENKDTVFYLLNVIASLHNELYKVVKGKYYDYVYHWANLGYGGTPNDEMFKEQEDKGDDA